MEEDYYKTQASVKEYIHLAKEVNGKQLIDKLKNVLSDRSTLLEIGSGPGKDWKILNQSYHAIGSDNSPEFLNYLGTTNPNGEFLTLDAVTLETDKKFDGIYSNKVLHHLDDSELVDSIRRQHEILHYDGIICHSFWKGTGFEIFKGLFVNYYNEFDLKKLFSAYFKVLSIENYSEFEDGDSLVLIAQKINH